MFKRVKNTMAGVLILGGSAALIHAATAVAQETTPTPAPTTTPTPEPSPSATPTPMAQR